MENYTLHKHKHNYTLETEVYTVEDYMQETDSSMEDVKYLYGECVKYFIWAMLCDEETGYAQRLFGAVYGNTYVGHTQALLGVTAELLDDYFTHLRKVYNSK